MCWYVDPSSGYVTSFINDKKIYFHRLVLGNPENMKIDHKNGNRNDNRKKNLRICNDQENARNKKGISSNTSGVMGVSYYKSRNNWEAYISINDKKIRIGGKYFENFDDAVKARLIAEKEFYGEFAPQKHLFKKYGV